MSKKLRLLSIIFLMMITIVRPQFHQARGDQKEAEMRISQAEDSIKAAYLSLLEAERSGGDISELVQLLNNALEYHSKSNEELYLGKYDMAEDLANKTVEASNTILEADVTIKVVAEHIEEVRFRNQLVMSLSIVCLIMFFGFLFWRKFKGYYITRMMGYKPGAVNHES